MIMASTSRYVFFFFLLGAISGAPMVILYLPSIDSFFASDIVLFDGFIFSVHIVVTLNARFLLQLVSTAIGLIGGFVVYCYVEYGRCHEDAFPQLEILLDEDA